MCGVFFLMSDKKIFFQDFLFKDMPVDEQDYPTIELKHLPDSTDISNFTIVSLDTMLKMNKPTEWDDLFKRIANRNVYIKDDVVITNSEMEPYKLFYLKAYYFNILKHSRNAYVLFQHFEA